jgi:threonine/homoserine/homoserine lactone efflux protein
MTIASSIALIFATFIFVITPGPGIIAIISTSLSLGFRYGMSLSLGLIMGDIVYLLVAIYGLSILMDLFGDFFYYVRVIGGLYFLYLGYTMVSSKVNRFKLQDTNTLSRKKSFLRGFFISSSNPKVILFYLGFLPAFMDLSTLTNQDVFIVVTLIFLTLLFGAFLYAFLVARAKEFIQDEQKLAALNKIAGFLMISVGLFLILG